MKILVLGSCSDEYRELGDIALKNKTEYCARYGYDYIEDNKIDYSCYAHPSWSKLNSIINNMKNYDWIFWSDADSLFMNHTIPLETFIDDHFNIIGSLFNSVFFNLAVIHTGNFLIKCDDVSRKILEESYKSMPELHPLREESGLSKILLNNDKISMVKLYPETTFATWVKDKYILDNKLHEIDWYEWSPYKRGDFINHFGSIIPFEGRVFLMKKYSRLIIK